MNVPSGYTALDLIGFTDRGDYDAQENYVKNDLVHYNGRVWLCLVDDTTEITPVAGANWKVWIDEAAYLSGLADVTISNPANGEAIRYNSQSGKWENVSVDSTPTSGSANLVQSGGVATQLANKANTADLATVATTGAYSDLSGTPQLAVVATSGAYSDLTGQPTIPTVNDATLTIQKNGTNVETFTANSSTNKTANITVPDVINDLSDVNISSVANEEILAYDSTSSKWKNSGALGALKETLTNNGAHNLNGTKYWLKPLLEMYGVTFSYNSDGTITANGTNNGVGQSDYIAGDDIITFTSPFDAQVIMRCETIGINNSDVYCFAYCATDSARPYTDSTKTSRMSASQNAYGNVEQTFWIEKDKQYRLVCRVTKGFATTLTNVVFKPMLRLASDTDTTFTPFAKTNQQLTKDTTGLIDNDFSNGAVNMLPNNATSQVVKGVTFTVNSDGSVTTTGTSTQSTGNRHSLCLIYDGAISPSMIGKRYKLTGAPSNGGEDKWDIYIGLRDSSDSLISGTEHLDFGNGIEFDVPSNAAMIHVYIRCSYNADVTSKVFKPMITLADMPDSDYSHYVPYAMTNRQLTDISEYKAGDSIFYTNAATLFFGFISNDMKTLYVAFDTSRKITATSATLTFNNFQIRGAQGNIGSQNDFSVTASFNKIYENILEMTISRTDGEAFPNTIAGSIICFTMTGGTVTFT